MVVCCNYSVWYGYSKFQDFIDQLVQVSELVFGLLSDFVLREYRVIERKICNFGLRYFYVNGVMGIYVCMFICIYLFVNIQSYELNRRKLKCLRV